MDTVQKMERYVERSRVFDHGHGMTQAEWVALIGRAEGGIGNICQAVSLAFNYGRGQGLPGSTAPLLHHGKERLNHAREKESAPGSCNFQERKCRTYPRTEYHKIPGGARAFSTLR